MEVENIFSLAVSPISGSPQNVHNTSQTREIVLRNKYGV